MSIDIQGGRHVERKGMQLEKHNYSTYVFLIHGYTCLYIAFDVLVR